MRSRTTVTLLALALSASCASLDHPAGAQEAAADPAKPRVLRVGPERDLKTPSAAAKIARNGDIIEIDAGTYAGDAAVWRAQHLTIRGVGGRAHLRADGAEAEGKGIWVVKGNDTTIEAIEFSGAKVSDENGAGIRLEGANLTVRDCYFHDNENGILTGANPASDVLVEHSEFARNGAGDGMSHNMYIGKVRSFTLRFSYVHHAQAGHDVKSRAARNTVTYNRIMDEHDGKSSYSVEFPNGGLSFLIGNLIQQGPQGENYTIVSYGTEGLQHPQNEFYMVNNTVVNDRPEGGRFVFVKPGSIAKIVNNVFSGPGEVLNGPAEQRGNVSVRRSDLVDADNFDYRLRPRAAAIGRAVDPGSAHGVALRPAFEYVHKAQSRARVNSDKLDAGALAYRPDEKP